MQNQPGILEMILGKVTLILAILEANGVNVDTDLNTDGKSVVTGDTVEVDNQGKGVTWDERIHIGTKTKTKKDIWTRGRGVDDELFDSVMKELLAEAAIRNSAGDTLEPTNEPEAGNKDEDLPCTIKMNEDSEFTHEYLRDDLNFTDDDIVAEGYATYIPVKKVPPAKKVPPTKKVPVKPGVKTPPTKKVPVKPESGSKQKALKLINHIEQTFGATFDHILKLIEKFGVDTFDGLDKKHHDELLKDAESWSENLQLVQDEIDHINKLTADTEHSADAVTAVNDFIEQAGGESSLGSVPIENLMELLTGVSEYTQGWEEFFAE